MNTTMKRRSFMASGALAAGAAMAGNTPAAAQETATAAAPEWRNRQPGMAYRRLGRTGYMISEVVMGGNTISPTNYEHVKTAIDMGLNYLDTAPAYGGTESEKGYGEILKDSSVREKVFVNTKVSLFDQNRYQKYKAIFDTLPADEQQRITDEMRDLIKQRGITESRYLGMYFWGQIDEIEQAYLSNVMEKYYGDRIDRRREYYQTIIQSVEDSLRRLNTDYVDLLMAPHGAGSPEEVRIGEIYAAFDKLKQDGKIRHTATSSHSDPAGVVMHALESGQYDAAMVAYNAVNGPYLDRVLTEAWERDFGIVAMKVARPLMARSHIATPQTRIDMLQHVVPGEWKVPQKAYLWALQNRHISAVISEMSDADLVRDNVPLAGVTVDLQPVETEFGTVYPRPES